MPAGACPLDRLDDLVVLLLDPDDAFARANHFHGRAHAPQKWLGVMEKQFLVLVEQ